MKDAIKKIYNLKSKTDSFDTVKSDILFSIKEKDCLFFYREMFRESDLISV